MVEEVRAGLTSLSCRKEGPGGPGGPWGPGGPLGPTPGSPWEEKMPGYTREHSPAMEQGSTHSPGQAGLTFSPLGPTSPGVPGKPCGPMSPWKTGRQLRQGEGLSAPSRLSLRRAACGCEPCMSAPTQSTQHRGGAELSLSWDRRWALLTLGIPEAQHVTPPYRQRLEEPASAACSILAILTGAQALCPLCGFVPCVYYLSCQGWSCATPSCLLPFVGLLLPKSLFVTLVSFHCVSWDKYLLIFKNPNKEF